MNRFLSNKITASIVALALLVGVGVLISSGDTSSTTRNAALVAGTPCTKVGQVTKISKQAVICAALSPKNIWYPVFQEKKWICAKLGITRKQNGIFSVCGKNKSSKKRWFLTKPLMANSNPGLPTTDQDAFIKLTTNPELIVETSPTTPLALAVTTETPATETTLAVTTVTTLAPAVPATLSLVTQPLGGANAVALETQPVVQLLDQRGASISTAGITITAVSGRTDVVLSGNTAVTDATGRATFKTLSLTGIMGDITLTFTAPGLEGITSDKFVLAAGAATQLVISSTTGSVVSGKAFDQQPVLHFEDSSANVIAVSGVDVIVTSSSQGLSGATTVATNKKGIAGFTDLALTQAGATTLTFTSGELSTTSEVTVVAGDYTTVKITTEASQAASNNTAFSQFPVVQLVDANNNKVATAGITVTVTITQFPASDTDKVATLLINTTATDTQGVATFTGLGIEGLIGKYTLGYTPTNGATQASEKTTTLSAGEHTSLIVLTSPAGPVGDDAAGTWSLTQSPVIGLRDISNNPVTTSGVGVTATVSKQTQTYTARTDNQGEATILVAFSSGSAGSRTITYSAVNLQATSTITLPLLTPVVQAWVLPTDKTTTSPVFRLTPPTSNSNAYWSYTSSEEKIATVTSAGGVTLTGIAGTTTITATQPATPKYESATTTANLVVALTPAVVSTAWVLPTGKTTKSPPFTLTAPTSNSNGGWSYASSDATKAIVSTPGTVTLSRFAGAVTITATQAATTKYASATTTAVLDVALAYSVGDTGPGGGIVFYDAGTTQSWGRYLEAAPTDYQINGARAKAVWGCDYASVIGTGIAIGTGKANTATILANCMTPGIAADVANKYFTNTAGAGQWFLPSKDELNELCKIYSNGRMDTADYREYQNGCTGSTSPTGGFAVGFYWSSSEFDSRRGRVQNFCCGNQTASTKFAPNYVRPVRAFG